MLKSLVFAAASILFIAGSAASMQQTNALSAQSPAKIATKKVAMIPPPTCPYNDPRGCGILD